MQPTFTTATWILVAVPLLAIIALSAINYIIFRKRHHKKG